MKRSLCFLVGLGMTRTRSQLAPAMSMQETVDGVQMHFMLHLRFIGLLNLLSRGNLSPFGSREKRLQKGLFLLDRQLVVMASTFGGLLDDCRSQAIVPSDDPMHCGS